MLNSFILAVLVAAALDIAANIMLADSHGFAKKKQGIIALLLVGAAFLSLSWAVRGMDLAVAYAMWGGFGVLGTSLGGWCFFNQKPKAVAWLGMALLICGMSFLHMG